LLPLSPPPNQQLRRRLLLRQLAALALVLLLIRVELVELAWVLLARRLRVAVVLLEPW
jgi:hypothetical protein